MKQQKKNQGIDPICNCTKTKKIRISLTDVVKDMYSEYYSTLSKLKMIQRNGKAFHACRLEEQTSLKCLYYPKQYTHLMQSL